MSGDTSQADPGEQDGAAPRSVRVTRESTLRLFPTLLETFDVELPDETTAAMRAELHEERDADIRAGVPGADRDWIGRADRHLDAAFRPLASTIEQLAHRAQRRSGLLLDGLQVVSMWGFGQRGAVLRDVHSHHNAYLSGVFYLEAPPGSGVISLVDPLQHLKVIQPSRDDSLSPEDPAYWDHLSSLDIQPHPGLLLLFPAWLYHSIGPSSPEVELRLSVAFNLMPRGPIGGRTGRFEYL